MENTLSADAIGSIVEAIQALPAWQYLETLMQAAEAEGYSPGASDTVGDAMPGNRSQQLQLQHVPGLGPPTPGPLRPPVPQPQQYARGRGTAAAARTFAQREIEAGRSCTWRQACGAVGFADAWSQSEYAPY